MVIKFVELITPTLTKKAVDMPLPDSDEVSVTPKGDADIYRGQFTPSEFVKETILPAVTGPKFDRVTYQREYMRGWRRRKEENKGK
jgi:hypothetical protein